MGTDSRSEQSKQRGFNLVEAAIVLALVGLVIGGIWVASAAVYENHKINKLVEGLIMASQKLRETISFSDAPLLPSSYGYAELTDYCISAKVFPDSFYNGNKIVTPFSGGTLPDGANANGGSIRCNINAYLSLENKIEITVGVETKQLCKKMVRAITTRFKDNSILANVVMFDANNSNSPLLTNWPLDGSQCNYAWMVTPLQIRLRFNFLRIN